MLIRNIKIEISLIKKQSASIATQQADSSNNAISKRTIEEFVVVFQILTSHLSIETDHWMIPVSSCSLVRRVDRLRKAKEIRLKQREPGLPGIQMKLNLIWFLKGC